MRRALDVGLTPEQAATAPANATIARTKENGLHREAQAVFSSS
jgi:hypothetical protein